MTTVTIMPSATRAHGDGMLQSHGDDRLLEPLNGVRINGPPSERNRDPIEGDFDGEHLRRNSMILLALRLVFKPTVTHATIFGYALQPLSLPTW